MINMSEPSTPTNQPITVSTPQAPIAIRSNQNIGIPNIVIPNIEFTHDDLMEAGDENQDNINGNNYVYRTPIPSPREMKCPERPSKRTRIKN